MPWTPDSPDDIAARLAAGWEAEFADAVPEGVDASSAIAPWAALARAPALALYTTQLGFAAEVADFFPDTCAVDVVPKHAADAGLYQAAPQAAGGFAAPPAGSTVGTVIPIGVTLGGGAYRVTSAVTVDGTGTESVPVAAVVAGAAGNLAAGTVLALDSPIAGLAAQRLTVDVDGLTGGSDQETLEQLRARVIAWRRRRGHGGGPGDYTAWAQNVYPLAIIKELPLWSGLGSVGLAVAFPGRAATSTEMSRIQAAVLAARPVTVSALTVLAATITPLALTIALDPDTTAVRAAVTAAYAAFLAAEPGIGGTVDYSRLRAALSSASGEYRHRLTTPVADVVAGTTEMFIPGSTTWASWS
jgi:uncharacterized phage protein gp47/JayE